MTNRYGESETSSSIFSEAVTAATLGDELTTNGTFTGTADGWTLGADWSYSSNAIVLDNTGATRGTVTQNITVEANKPYLVSWSQTNSVAQNASIRPSIDSVNGSYIVDPTAITVKPFSQVITPTVGGVVALTFTVLNNTSTGTVTIDTVSVKAVNQIPGALTVNGSTIVSDATNLGFGYYSLRSNTTGSNNTASGSYSLASNTTGSNNTASGGSSLASNTTGNNNTASGYASLAYNTTGFYNTASGYASLYYNTTGSNNTASGHYSLHYNTTGSYNTASGSYSLYSNTTGSNNMTSGYASLYYNTTGSNNTTSGDSSLYSNTTGSYNTANGYSSLASNTTGINNTASGYDSLAYNTTGSNNNCFGCYAGCYNLNSNKLYIDAFDRSSTAGDDAGAIITGTMSATPANQILRINAKVGIGTGAPASAFSVAGSVQVADDAAVASVTNVGSIRYRADANNSYCEMVMQTAASTYAWVEVKKNTW